MLTIYREGLTIIANEPLEPAEGSYNVPVQLIETGEDTYSGSITMYVGYYQKGIIKKRSIAAYEPGKFRIPGIALQQNGPLFISFMLENEDKTEGLMTNTLTYIVKDAPYTIIDPTTDPTWQEQVKAWIEEMVGGVSVDKTLTASGKAADAKVVGDKFNKLSEEIANISIELSTDDGVKNAELLTDALSKNNYVSLKNGVYPLSTSVTIPSYTTLDLNQSTIYQTEYKSTNPLIILDGVNVTLKNGSLKGTYDLNDDDEGYEFFEQEVLMSVKGVENGLIENIDGGFAWGVSLAFCDLAQDRVHIGEAESTNGKVKHLTASQTIVDGYRYVMAYGGIGYNYIFSIEPIQYVFYDSEGTSIKTVTEIPRVPVEIPKNAVTFTIQTTALEFTPYYYGFTNIFPTLTVRDCYFHNNHSGGMCNSTHIITVENCRFAFMGTIDNTKTPSSRSTIYGIDIEDIPTPFMRLSNCSFFKCPKAVMDGSYISQIDNCYAYDCEFGVYRGWYHIYNNLTVNYFYVMGHGEEWQYPRIYMTGCKSRNPLMLHDNSGEYLFINSSESDVYYVSGNEYVDGEYTPFTTYVRSSYSPYVATFKSILRNVNLIDYSIDSESRCRLYPKKGSTNCIWKTPYKYTQTYLEPIYAPYDISGLTTDMPIFPNGYKFYDCVFKCRHTGFTLGAGQLENAFVGTYEDCIIDCDGGSGSLFPYSNLGGTNGARKVNLVFNNCVINNSKVPLLFGANTWVHSFKEGSTITFNNCTILNTEATGIIGNGNLTNLTVTYN